MKESAPPLVDATTASRIVAAAVTAGALQREAALALAGVGFRGEPINLALGYRPRRGRRRPETSARIERRDKLICAVIEKHFGGRVGQRARSQALHTEWVRYRANAYRLEPGRRETAGSLKADLQVLCRICVEPLATRTIARILSLRSAP